MGLAGVEVSLLTARDLPHWLYAWHKHLTEGFQGYQDMKGTPMVKNCARAWEVCTMTLILNQGSNSAQQSPKYLDLLK